MKKRKIAVLGTQASGKGTQAALLARRMGVPAVSVGDLLRDLQHEASERGRAAKTQMMKGSFVSEEVIFPLLDAWMKEHSGGWIVDGFPRSLEQAKASEPFFSPDAVIYLEIPDDVSRRRISFRRICAKCKTNYNLITQPPKNPQGACDACGGELVRRADDTPELVDERLRNYHEVTEPVKQWYEKKGKLIRIDGRPSVEEVERQIDFRLKRLETETRSRRRGKIWLFVAVLVALTVCAMFIVIGFILEP